MTITASMVKELRERTGAGMMECKKALVTQPVVISKPLRKNSESRVRPRLTRRPAESLPMVASWSVTDDGKAVIAEVNSETDFVAKDENFIRFAEAVAAAALASDTTDVTMLAAQSMRRFDNRRRGAHRAGHKGRRKYLSSPRIDRKWQWSDRALHARCAHRCCCRTRGRQR